MKILVITRDVYGKVYILFQNIVWEKVDYTITFVV